MTSLAQAVLVMLCVALIAFMLFQFVGDPVSHMLGQDATAEQIREARDALGLNNSILTQFWHFLSNAVQGDFGFSLRQGSKVSTLVAELTPSSRQSSGTVRPASARLSASMIWLSVKRDFFMVEILL